MSGLVTTPDPLAAAGAIAQRRPGYAYELKNGRLALDHVLTASEIQLDKGRMRATGVFVSSSIDRVGDRISMPGIRTENHRRNPVVLWNHGQNPNADMPIGKTEDEHGSYLVQIGDHEGIATTVFSQSLPLAVQIFNLIDEKILRAQSIGFDKIRVQPLRVDGRYLGDDLLEIEMVETSWTGIGCNPDALLMAIHKNWDGRPLDPAIRAVIVPYAATLKVWAYGAAVEKSESPAVESEPPPQVEPQSDDDSEQARLDTMADIIGGIMAHPGAKAWLAAVSKDWDETKHPRAADGRFGSGSGHAKPSAAKPPKPPKSPVTSPVKPAPSAQNVTLPPSKPAQPGKPGQTPAPAPAKPRQLSSARAGGKQAQAAAKQAVEQILAGAITKETHGRLLQHLPKLTVPQLREIAAQHNLKCPAKLKGQVLEKLASHFNAKIIKTGSVDVAKVANTLKPFEDVPLSANETRFTQADYLTIQKQYGTLAGHRIKELAVNALQAMRDLPGGSAERETFRKKLAGYAWMARQAQKDGITGTVEPKDGSDFAKNVDRIALGERLREKHGNGATWTSFLIESIKNEFAIDTPGLTADELELPNHEQGRILADKRQRQAEQIWANLKDPRGSKYQGDRLDRALANLRADYGTMTQEQFFRVLPHLRERRDKLTPEVIAAASKGHKALTRKNVTWDESRHPRASDGRFGSGGGHSEESGGGNSKPKPETPSEPAPTPKGAKDKLKASLAKLAALGAKGIAIGSHIEHAAKEAIKTRVSKLPPALQMPTVGLWSAAMASYTAANAAVKAVAAERGNTPEQVERIAGICSALDIVGAKAGPLAVEFGAHATGAAPFAAGFVPLGSVGYLAFATATNPLATWRAAKKTVAAVREKGVGATVRDIAREQATLSSGHKSRGSDGKRDRLIGIMLDMVKAAPDPDLWAATLFASLDAAEGDLVAALKMTAAAKSDDVDPERLEAMASKRSPKDTAAKCET